MSYASSWRGVAAMTVTAVALSVLWMLGCVWIGSLVGVFFPQTGAYEGVVVANDGTPLVSSRPWHSYDQIEYRTLEGAPVSLATDAGLGGARLVTTRRGPALVDYPMPWSSRVLGATNYARPGNAWYLVRDDARPGKACFEVFDQSNKARVGFYGRNGMRQTLPDREEWFDVGDGDFSWNSRSSYTGRATIGPGQHVYRGVSATDEGAITPWMFYVKDGDAVLEIDLRKRTHRELLSVEGLLAIGMLSEPLPADASEEEQQKADPKPEAAPTLFQLRVTPAAFTTTFTVASPFVDTERKSKSRLAVRGPESVMLVDPKTDHVDTFKLPEWARGRDLNVYSVGADQLLLSISRGFWSGGSVTELVWIDPEGKETRREKLELAGYVPPTERSMVWAMSGLIPLPVVSTAHWLGYRPFKLMQDHKTDDYATAARRSTEEGWPAVALVFALGFVMAGAVFALHRRAYRPQPLVWAVAAGLLGPAGLLAYLLSWRRPPMVACASCGQRVPRDREACPACRGEWVLPASKGTEIFDLEAA